ncbi:MAG: hypothetical protein HRU29_11640 [Rhizobiales bacterium]|nr:phage tail protein [Hyphomicrobiales bacterium]NRB15042.1 hypothetical protein [Hyphomicrobiales bacterium]
MGEKARSMGFKMEDPGLPGTFIFAFGIKSTSFERSTNMVDTTVPDADDPSLPINKTVRPGMKELSIEGDGLFQDHITYQTINAAYEGQNALVGKLLVPGLGEFTCAAGWHINKLSLSGDMEDDLAMSIGFEPAGQYVFTAEA